MIARLALACSVMAVCVAIHASGLAWAIGWLRRRPARLPGFAPHLRLVIVMAVWIVLLHLAEVPPGACSTSGPGALSDLNTALYFSAVTYTTTG